MIFTKIQELPMYESQGGAGQVRRAVKYLNQIPTTVASKQVLLRLGYNSRITVINENQQRSLDAGMQRGIVLCQLAGAYCRIGIVEHATDRVILENAQLLESANLAKLLDKSDEVLLMGATVGRDVVDFIRSEVASGNAAQGIVIDAVASETADAGLDWIMEAVNQMLSKEGKKLTRHRYSPGYGDLQLKEQRLIFDLLDFSKLKVNLSEAYILEPEKSVLAIAGIEPLD